MLRLRHAVEIEPVDLAVLQVALGRSIERWRDVRFVDGHVVDPATGTTRDGLQVVIGAHPEVGVAYRCFAPPPKRNTPRAVEAAAKAKALGGSTEPAWTSTQVEVVADRSRRVEVLVRQREPTPVHVGVAFGPRDAPDHLDVEADVEAPGSWPKGGRVHLELDARVDRRFDRAGDRVARATGAVRHPVVRASGTVEVAVLAADRWEVTVCASVRGRGLLRPVVAIALAWVRKAAQRELVATLDRLAPDVARFNEEHRIAGSQVTPDDLAAAWIADLIASVPATVPADVQSRA